MGAPLEHRDSLPACPGFSLTQAVTHLSTASPPGTVSSPLILASPGACVQPLVPLVTVHALAQRSTCPGPESREDNAVPAFQSTALQSGCEGVSACPIMTVETLLDQHIGLNTTPATAASTALTLVDTAMGNTPLQCTISTGQTMSSIAEVCDWSVPSQMHAYTAASHSSEHQPERPSRRSHRATPALTGRQLNSTFSGSTGASGTGITSSYDTDELDPENALVAGKRKRRTSESGQS